MSEWGAAEWVECIGGFLLGAFIFAMGYLTRWLRP